MPNGAMTDDVFVDVFEMPFETDCALLFCSDGLSDLLPLAELTTIVEAHAGKPQDVVTALINAANDVSGKDNITVIFVEAPGFAAAFRRGDAMSADVPDTPDHPCPCDDAAAKSRRADAARRRGVAARIRRAPDWRVSWCPAVRVGLASTRITAARAPTCAGAGADLDGRPVLGGIPDDSGRDCSGHGRRHRSRRPGRLPGAAGDQPRDLGDQPQLSRSHDSHSGRRGRRRRGCVHSGCERRQICWISHRQ